jgi:hypothetical protein
MTSPGFKSPTFRPVAQCINPLRSRVALGETCSAYTSNEDKKRVQQQTVEVDGRGKLKARET